MLCFHFRMKTSINPMFHNALMLCFHLLNGEGNSNRNPLFAQFLIAMISALMFKVCWFMFSKSHVLWKLKAVPMFHNACMFQICWTMFSVCVCVCSVCVCVCVWGSEIFTFGWSSLARGGARILPSVTPTLSVLFIEPCTLPYICVVCIVDSQHSVYFSL